MESPDLIKKYQRGSKVVVMMEGVKEDGGGGGVIHVRGRKKLIKMALRKHIWGGEKGGGEELGKKEDDGEE